MTASVSPGGTTVNENTTFFRNFTAQDQDKLRRSSGEIITVGGGSITVIATDLQSSSNSATITLNSHDANTGTYGFTASSKAKQVSQERTYIDTYSVVDNSEVWGPILIDPNVTVAQQVVVQNVP